MDICLHFLTVYLGMELLGHMMTMLHLWRNCQIFPKHHFACPSAVCEGSNCSTSSPTSCYNVFFYSHASGNESVFSLILTYISLMSNEVEYLFLCLLAAYSDAKTIWWGKGGSFSCFQGTWKSESPHAKE